MIHIMQSNTFFLPSRPAASDPLAAELYNQQHIDKDVRRILASHLSAHLKTVENARVLLLGGRGGLVAEMLLPLSRQIDIVEQEPFAQLLEERFLRGNSVDYFFGREGHIGTRHLLPPPELTAGQYSLRHLGRCG